MGVKRYIMSDENKDTKPKEKEEEPKPPQGQLVIPMPPEKIFLFQRKDVEVHQSEVDPLLTVAAQNEEIPVLNMNKGYNGIDYPMEGGQLVWHIGRPFPRKGHVYPAALQALYFPKRIFLGALRSVSIKSVIPLLLLFGILPKKMKGKILDNFIYNYLQIVYDILVPHFLDPHFYIDICRELSQPIMTFLKELGVSDSNAARFTLVFITILEYDGAYRLRLEDILTTTTKERLLKNPAKELALLVKILAMRDTRKHLVDKFNRFAWLMKYGIFFIRKPFRKAIMAIKDFSKVQLDDIDRYTVVHQYGYNFFGLTIEQRVRIWPLPKREHTPSFGITKDKKVKVYKNEQSDKKPDKEPDK